MPRLGLRHLQALLLFLGLVVNTILQFNVGVAVVAMTNATSVNAELPVSELHTPPFRLLYFFLFSFLCSTSTGRNQRNPTFSPASIGARL